MSVVAGRLEHKFFCRLYPARLQEDTQAYLRTAQMTVSGFQALIISSAVLGNWTMRDLTPSKR